MRAPRDEYGHAQDVGQGGYFGDYEGHSDIGRRGGQVRHERAMRAPRDEYGHAEDVGQGGYFGDYEGHSDIGRRGGEVRHERAMRAHRDAGDYEYGGRGRSRYDDEDDDRRYRRH
jgi:general stress protein YciG